MTTAPRPIFDAHLDLAWCALSFNRDLTQSVEELRRREQGMTDSPARGHNTLSLPELKRAGVRVCVATLLARSGPQQAFKPGYSRTDLDYSSPSIACAAAHGQLAYYRLLEQQGHVRMLRTARDLAAHWQAGEGAPLGIILSMEGTDPIVTPAQLQEWWDLGLRAAGLCHYGVGRHGYGTAVDGPLSDEGVALLREFERLGMVLDVTHLSDQSMAHALDVFGGRVLASHHNCRALVPNDRQLSDDQIKQLIARGAVIGAALDAWMLYPGWVRGQTQPEAVGLTLEALADHIERVCQLAGSSRHAAIGSDLDGGYGFEQTPGDLKVYSDLHKLGDILATRGFSDADIDLTFHGNWLRFYGEALPQ